MSFASESGYIPVSIEALMNVVRVNVNTQMETAYTESEFLGTNYYKYFYAIIQRLQENEVKTSEIFQNLQQYFAVTNENLNRPNTTAPGIFDYFESKGYFVSVKPPADLDAGKIYICVDTDPDADDYADVKLALCGYVRDCVAAGVISQGTETEELTLSNNQAFTFKYNLPDKLETLLKLTLVLSDNNEFTVESPDWIKERLLANIAERYQLGKNFEPQRYFSIMDAPWAASILLEWSINDGDDWSSDVHETDYDEVLDVSSANTEIVEE